VSIPNFNTKNVAEIPHNLGAKRLGCHDPKNPRPPQTEEDKTRGKKKTEHTPEKKHQKKLLQLPPNKTRNDTFKTLQRNTRKKNTRNAKEKYEKKNYRSCLRMMKVEGKFSGKPKVSCCHGSKLKPHQC